MKTSAGTFAVPLCCHRIEKTEGRIELDKSSEKKVPLKNQAGLTTQLPSALIYLLFGRYGNKVLSELSSMPDNLPDNLAI